MPLSLTKGVYIFDLEADALLDNITKIHCLSIGKVMKNGDLKIITTTDYEEMKSFFLNKEITKVGHNIIRYDSLAAEAVLGIKVPTNSFIDTLPLSWYLYPKNQQHGLKWWGEMIGNSKINIDDWENLPEDAYIERCEVDVQINYELWKMQKDYLLQIYRTEEAAIDFIKYSNFKSICVREQEQIGIRFDIDRARSISSKLEIDKAEKVNALAKVIPPEDITGTKTIPKEMYKKDGSMSKKWQDWLEFKRQYGIPDDWTEPVKYVKGHKEGNPNSPIQIKNWLFGLGWEPCTYSYTRNKETNEVKTVPQIYNKETGEITPSVVKLIDQEPGIEILNGLGKIKHRLGLINGLIENSVEQEDGTYRIYASISGYANTMRMQHKVITNLPKVGIFLGEEIRGCFIADEGCTLASADLSNIESTTRNHYIYNFDKGYVEDMDRPDFDSHCDIAILANLISVEDAAWFIETTRKIEKEDYHLEGEEEKLRYKDIKGKRAIAKTINFASVYGCSPKTMARNTGMKLSFCTKLIDTYWQRNWAVRAFADTVVVREVGGQYWAFNPISKFWYSLRSEKDRFSTINQSSACYVFDCWLKYVRKLKVKVIYQCHDELLFNIPIGEEEYYRGLLQCAIDKTNEELQLNVQIRQSPSFGFRYSECH